MFLLLNTRALGGNALKKWDRIKNSLPLVEFEAGHKVDNNSNANLDISNAILKGERKFIAAGGDGTINYLLNEILSNPSKTIIDEIQIGSIGLGSSNDFHKPMNSSSLINGIPCKVDFTTTAKRDIGCITYVHNERRIKKYFLINASIGVTAEANYFFNHPNFILKLFKRINTSAAIIYSAIHTILRYKNIELKMIDSNNITKIFRVANLAITKSPYISGNLKLNYTPNYKNGLLNIHLLCDTTKIELIKILRQLQNNKANAANVFNSSQSSSILIKAEKPFKVEFDGEIIRTHWVRFSLLKKRIRVCMN
ncbi:MAG: diacylglycerol kinase family lipid kinase [Ignavibacteria bacterium]|nr:MAG: diacylglycerol kinase family lipid kinase [Ignavibacteria bacterium]